MQRNFFKTNHRFTNPLEGFTLQMKCYLSVDYPKLKFGIKERVKRNPSIFKQCLQGISFTNKAVMHAPSTLIVSNYCGNPRSI